MFLTSVEANRKVAKVAMGQDGLSFPYLVPPVYTNPDLTFQGFITSDFLISPALAPTCVSDTVLVEIALRLKALGLLIPTLVQVGTFRSREFHYNQDPGLCMYFKWLDSSHARTQH